MVTAHSCVYPPLQQQGPVCALLDTASKQGSSPVRVRHCLVAAVSFVVWMLSILRPLTYCTLWAGMGSFLLYSVHEGIRGIPLEPADKSDALVPVSGTSLAVGIDFHAGEWHWKTSVNRWDSLSDILMLSLSPIQRMTPSTGWIWAWAPSAEQREIKLGERMWWQMALAGWRASL